MLPYFLLLFVSAVMPGILYRPKPLISKNGYLDMVKKRNKLTQGLFFGGFFMLLALRGFSVGTDIRTY